MRYLNFMDGLRAIAVCSVFLYHLNADLVPNGYLGVDIFFVISGFIVSYAVASRPALSFGRFFLDFYARRFVRIIPALIVCLLLTSLAAILFIPDAWVSNTQYKTARMAFWGLSNVQLAGGTDYFSPITEYNPFTHTWSLGVEEQFYVLFPLLFFPWMMSRSGRRFSFAACVLAAIASFAIWLHLRNAQPLHAFYLIHARFWELAVGVACFQLTAMLKERGIAFRPAGPSLIALAALIAALFVKLPPGSAWVSNLAAVAATAIIIASLQQKPSDAIVASLLRSAPLTFLGKISYSLYLWHWPVFVLARWTSGLDTLPQLLAASALAILLALGSYYFIEMPARHSAWLHKLPRARVVGLGLATVLCGWAVFDLASANRASLSLSTVMRNRDLWIADMPRRAFADLPGCTIQESRQGIAAQLRRAGCPEQAARAGTVYFMGDSHAAAYIQLLKRFTLLTGMDSTLVTTAGCPFLSLKWERDTEPACAAVIKSGTAFLEAAVKPGDLVFLPSLRLPRFDDQFVRFSDESVLDAALGASQARDRARAIDHAVTVLEPLVAKGATILFEAPKPIFRAASFRCSDWFNRSNPACSDGLTIERDLLLKLRQPVLDAFGQVAKRVPQVSVWDPLPALCPGERCSVFQEGRPLFFDGDHVSGFANIFLTPSFVAAATAALDGARRSDGVSR